MLKGGYTLIAAPNGATYSVAGGSPWLATAGSGDTLTGIYGALLAQTVAAFDARGEALEGCTFASIGALAVYLHGEAARASATGSVKDALPGNTRNPCRADAPRSHRTPYRRIGEQKAP